MATDTVQRLIAFGNKTTGRDKLCRLFQYSFRGLADLLDTLADPKFEPWIKRFKGIDYNISTARKLLRLGKSLDMLYQAKNALHIRDTVVQLCVTLSRITSACFLFLDHIIWLSRVNAIRIKTKSISELANRFWLLSTILNLMRNCYDWYRIRYINSKRMKNNSYKPLPITAVLLHNQPVLLDTVKNMCDILIPLHGLHYLHVRGIVQGITGALSSVIGIATVWNDNLKLVNR